MNSSREADAGVELELRFPLEPIWQGPRRVRALRAIRSARSDPGARLRVCRRLPQVDAHDQPDAVDVAGRTAVEVALNVDLRHDSLSEVKLDSCRPAGPDPVPLIEGVEELPVDVWRERRRAEGVRTANWHQRSTLVGVPLPFGRLARTGLADIGYLPSGK